MSNTNTSGLGRLADVALDGAAIGGAGLITYGVHLVYHPAGVIIAGLFMLAGAWFTARKVV